MENSLSTICDNCGKQFSNVYTLNAHKRQVHERKKPYQCSLCIQNCVAFSTKYKLNRHIQGIHSETRDKFCEICGQSFKTREMLIKHHRTHYKGPFTCEICQEVFKYKASFDHHFKIKHEIKENNDTKVAPKVRHHECKACFKVYKNLKSLQNHEQSHIKPSNEVSTAKPKKSSKHLIQELFTCYACSQNFIQKTDFETHLATHDQEDFRLDDMIKEGNTISDGDVTNDFIVLSDIEYIKDESIVDYRKINDSPDVLDSKFFIENEEYEALDNSNSDDENCQLDEYHQQEEVIKKDDFKKQESIICDICGMLFKNKSHLRRHHARKHRDKSDYKYECDVCAAKFLLRYDLQRHMVKHVTVRNIECPQCNKQFKTKNSLDCHIKFIHQHNRGELSKQFFCNICSRSYFHKRHLDYHMRKHTDDRRYTCDKCDKSFLYSDAVKWHQIRVHKEAAPFMCNICSRKFIHEKTYETHLKEHDNETGSLSVPCPICKKKISEKRHLPRHIRTHSKKSFTCDYCHESFKERFQLTKHLLQCEDKHNKNVEIIYETIVE